MKSRIWAALAAFALTLGLLVGVPVTTASTTPQGVAVTALGQPVDSAAAAGSIYYRSTGGSMYVIYNRLGYSQSWYRLYAGKYASMAVMWKPMPGWGAIWYREGDGRMNVAKCYAGFGLCGDVINYGDTVITAVYRL